MKGASFIKDRWGRLFLWSLALLSACALGLGLLELPVRMQAQPYGGASQALLGEGRFAVVLCADTQAQRSKLQSIKQFYHRAGGDLLMVEGGPEEAAAALEAWQLEHPGGEWLALGYGTQAGTALELARRQGTPPAGAVLLSPLALNETARERDFPLLILGTASDTAPTPAALTELYNHLSGDTIKPTGLAFQSERANCRLEIVSGVVDAYQGYSRSILTALANWSQGKLPLEEVTVGGNTLRLVCWLGAAVSLGLLLLSGYELAQRQLIDIVYSVVPLQVVDKGKFMLAKVLLWILSLPLLLLLLGIVWLLPGEPPIWGLCVCCYLFSYHFLSLLLYRMGRMPGVKGTLADLNLPHSVRRTLLGLAAFSLLALCLLGLGASGLFTLHWRASQLPWFLLFTAMSALAFYQSGIEELLLSQAKFPVTAIVTASILPLLPLVALMVFSLPAAGFTALLALFFYLMLLALLLLLDRTVQLLSGRPVLSAVGCALLYAGFIAFAAI